MVISHNLMAMNAQNQVKNTTNVKKKATEKLSTGYKINRAADDAAGLSISEKMRRQIRGLTQASENCQDGVSLVQIADGGLNEVSDMLHRCTELSVKAANGTLSYDERESIQEEVSHLINEIDRIAERTTFNEIPVLQGQRAGITYQSTGGAVVSGGLPGFIVSASPSLQAGHLTGTYNDGTTTYAAGVIDFSGVNASNINELNGQGFCMTCATCDKHYSVAFTDNASPSPAMTQSGNHRVYYVSTNGITNGTDLVNRIYTALDNGRPNSHYTQLQKDGAKLTVYDNRGQNNETGNMSALTSYQNNSVLRPGIAIDGSQATESEGVPDLIIQAGTEADHIIEMKLPAINSTLMGINGANVTTQAGAGSAITSFKNALSYVAGERSRMGAYQNRLEHTIQNLDNVVENTTAAESRIRDTDMAKETVKLSAASIFEQAGTSMISQANQSSQAVMTLLQ
ncbi:MAG: flagellar protein [Lachnospiraceae bacterium]|nr:flagellar protein [Lachnospiraceae bacterium]